MKRDWGPTPAGFRRLYRAYFMAGKSNKKTWKMNPLKEKREPPSEEKKSEVN